MLNAPITPQQRETLANLAESANEKLESAGQTGANHAFNLGCYVSLLPAAAIILAAFIFGRGRLVVALVAGMLVLVAILGFANLAAYIAKSRTIDRTYELNVNPEIERTLKGMDITRPSFDSLAGEILPERAALRNYLPVPPSGEEDSERSSEE